MRILTLAGLLAAAGCTAGDGTPAAGPAEAGSAERTPVTVRATHYAIAAVDAVPAGRGVPLRDMNNDIIGPTLSAGDWCDAAEAGTVRVDGQVYEHAGTREPKQAVCRHARERVRWAASPHPFGTGPAGTPLVPYRTIACDLGTAEGSTPWADGAYPEPGQRIHIPAAEGTVLPDGSIHDGIFTCGDAGGSVTGNHVDVFIGAAGGDAAAANPFAFITGAPDGAVEAFLLPGR